jgi:hypothetical protein
VEGGDPAKVSQTVPAVRLMDTATALQIIGSGGTAAIGFFGATIEWQTQELWPTSQNSASAVRQTDLPAPATRVVRRPVSH